MAVISGVIAVIGVIVVIVNAGDNADDFVRNHPDQSRAIGLAGSYLAAGFVAVLAGLTFLGARNLNGGRRSGWILLLILAGVGLLGLVGAHSLIGFLSSIPDLVLLGCLLAPNTRKFVERPTSSLPA